MLIEKILPNKNLVGLYQLSGKPINKFSLLNLIADAYHKKIEIIQSTDLQIDRSLNSELLSKTLNLEIPSWKALILEMHDDYKNRYEEYRCKN